MEVNHASRQAVDNGNRKIHNNQKSPALISHCSPISSDNIVMKVGSAITPSSLSSSQVNSIHSPSPDQSGKILFTPLSRRYSKKNKGKQTAVTSSVPFYNPFEKAADALHLPTVSPSLFREVVSPSVKEDEKFAWTIDQLAVLHPSNIETSPFANFEFPIDPEYERKAQEAIDTFFSTSSVVPSPWMNQSQPVNLMSAIWSTQCLKTPVSQSASPELIGENTVSMTTNTWSQTVLTLPPKLPQEVERILAPFCNFNQDQNFQMADEQEDSGNVNNTTLRRKLLFNQEKQSISTPISSSEAVDALPLEDEETVHPWGVSMIRPCSRVTVSPPGKEWCSSPSWGRRSTSPLDRVSPIRRFSPAEFRTIRSPNNSDDEERPVPSPPNLSPIRAWDHDHYSTPLSIDPNLAPPMVSSFTSEIPTSVIESANTNCRSPNSSLLQVHLGASGSCCSRSSSRGHSVSSRTHFNNILEKEEAISDGPPCRLLGSPEGPSGEIYDAPADDGFSGDDDVVSMVNDSYMSATSGMIMSPQVGRSKPSPQFSSSPIRGTEASSRRIIQLENEGGLECSPHFSGSQLSPISWRKERTAGGDYSDDGYQNSGLVTNEVNTERRYHDGNTERSGPLAMQASIEQSLENSVLGDTTAAQETGYQSGSSSLQITNNFSLQNPGTNAPNCPYSLNPKPVVS